MNLSTTTAITAELDYIEGADAFTQAFAFVWDSVRCQILKYESRQEYQEPGNPSFEALVAGKREKAFALIPESHADDLEIYAELRQRGVDFVRCRPVRRPATIYLDWELETYKFNAEQGERIFLCNYIAVSEIVEDFARHDFMVFDARAAAIYLHDVDGLLIGGWITDDLDHITELMKIFSLLKSQSHSLGVALG